MRRSELTNAIRSRYSASSGGSKRKILDEFIAATGYHEKSAIRVLNEHPSIKVPQTRQRPSLYDEAARTALIVLWEVSDRVCGKRAITPLIWENENPYGRFELDMDIRIALS